MPPKRKRAKADPDAWRQVIFYWRGRISSTEAGVSWEGNWLGSDGAVPGATEISDGEKFKCCSTSGASLSAGQLFTPERGPFSLSFSRSFYFLDNGDGVSKYEDVKHEVLLLSPKNADTPEGSPASLSMLAIGRGTNEFGAFISAGYVEAGDGGRESIMLLARRYVPHDDARHSLSLEELHKRVWTSGECLLASGDRQWGQVLLPLQSE